MKARLIECQKNGSQDEFESNVSVPDTDGRSKLSNAQKASIHGIDMLIKKWEAETYRLLFLFLTVSNPLASVFGLLLLYANLANNAS